MKKPLAILLVLTFGLALAATAFADSAKGEGIYMNFCAACHAGGVAGAPKVGDKVAWQDRSAKGMESMIANAVQGYQGKSGFMPAKGGNTALTEQEVAAAVMYMLEQSR